MLTAGGNVCTVGSNISYVFRTNVVFVRVPDIRIAQDLFHIIPGTNITEVGKVKCPVC